MWQFASTRGFIFLLAVQSIDPEELQALDTFLGHQSILRVSNVDYHRRTEGSLQGILSAYSDQIRQSDI